MARPTTSIRLSERALEQYEVYNSKCSGNVPISRFANYCMEKHDIIERTENLVKESIHNTDIIQNIIDSAETRKELRELRTALGRAINMAEGREVWMQSTL